MPTGSPGGVQLTAEHAALFLRDGGLPAELVTTVALASVLEAEIRVVPAPLRARLDRHVVGAVVDVLERAVVHIVCPASLVLEIADRGQVAARVGSKRRALEDAETV